MNGIIEGQCPGQVVYGGIVPAFAVWTGLIVLVLMLVFYWMIRGSKSQKETPQDILLRRLVSGEISKKEYMELKKELAG